MTEFDAFVGVLGGLITVIVFIDKIGVRKMLKDLLASKKYQEEAFVALLKYHLEDNYQHNRLFKAWTVDECAVQTAMHNAYIGLGGNGEAVIWWKNQEKWEVVSDNEMAELKGTCAFKIDQEARIKARRRETGLDLLSGNSNNS